MEKIDLPKLGIIGTVGVPAKYGGFETLAHHLVLNLNHKFDITVYNSENAYSDEEKVAKWKGAKMVYVPLNANGIQSIFYDLYAMFHAIRNCEYLLVLGVSAGLFFPIFKLFSKKRIIVNIDGLEWRRPKWNWFAKMYLLLSEMIACRFADEVITDNRILKEYVKIRYNKISSLIEYGADHVSKQEKSPKNKIQFPFLNKDYAFKVARIEPENNIEMVLEAFSSQSELDLVLVGNWDLNNYSKKIRIEYSQFSNIHLIDPIYKTETLDVLRSNAYVYVHGHSAGGTNPSLVEAMYLKMPIISFDVIFNRVTTNNQAIYFSDVEELLKIINNIEKFPLYAIAENLKGIADKQYTWKNISLKYAKTINPNYNEPLYLPNLNQSAFEKRPRVEAV